MLVINYKGNTPQQRFYSLGVKGNNKANTIRFVLQDLQEELDLSQNYSVYLKVESKEHEYIDKIPLEISNDDDFVHIDWTMTRKSTQYRNIALQLQFEDLTNDVVFQTLIVELELSGTIKADEQISEQNPSVLEQLEKDVKDVKDDVDDLEVEVEKKVNKVSQANRVYGTDANGNQTTYDKDDFGQVDDVKVNNVSVVSNKVANIDLTGKLDKVNSAKKLYGTNSNGNQTTYDEDDYAKLLGELPSFLVNTTDNVYQFVMSNDLNEKPICIKYSASGGNRFIGYFLYHNSRMRFYFLSLIKNTYYIGIFTETETTFNTIFGSSYSQNIETTSNKITTINESSTHTQYPSAKAVWTLVQAIKRNAFTPVDITTYPTLADFLASTGEEGYLYLYPVDTTDLTKGYKQYIWESNAWVYLGDTQLDLTNYPRKDQNETITGTWTFGNINTYNIYARENDCNLGGTAKRFKAFLNKILKNNATYGITLPDMTSWTADKEIATTDTTFNVINASDIVSNTLTQEQYDLITNGKPTLIKGNYGNNYELVLLPSHTSTSSYFDVAGLCYYTNQAGRSAFLSTYTISSSKVLSITSSDCSIEFDEHSSILQFNSANAPYFRGKRLPNYPSNTGTFNFQSVGGTLSYKALGSYVADNSITELSYDDISVISLTADTTFTLKTPASNSYPEYKANITNSGASAITITLTGVSKILCNDDNCVVVNGTNSTITLPTGVSIEASIVNGKCVAVNFEA